MAADFFGKDILARNASAWEASIGRQVKDVPAFDRVILELHARLEKLIV
jgi:hypothetical protein